MSYPDSNSPESSPGNFLSLHDSFMTNKFSQTFGPWRILDEKDAMQRVSEVTIPIADASSLANVEFGSRNSGIASAYRGFHHEIGIVQEILQNEGYSDSTLRTDFEQGADAGFLNDKIAEGQALYERLKTDGAVDEYLISRLGALYSISNYANVIQIEGSESAAIEFRATLKHCADAYKYLRTQPLSLRRKIASLFGRHN